MSESYDDLKCGNCGSDGGLANLKEQNHLREEISVLKQELAKDSHTRRVKLCVMGIVTVLLGLMLTIGSCNIFSPPDQITKTENHIHPTSLSTAYEKVSKNYEYCIGHSYNEGERTHCTDKLHDIQNILLMKLDKDRAERP